VCRLQGLGDLAGQAEGFDQRQRSSPQALFQRFALDELEHKEAFGSRFVQAMDRGNRRMVQRGQDARLAFEAREALRVLGECLGEDLDSDLPAEAGIASTVNLAHLAGAQRGEDRVRSELRPGMQNHGCSLASEL
jgi:hypothetical protein